MNSCLRIRTVSALLGIGILSAGYAQDRQSSAVDGLRDSGVKINTIAPVFSQLVSFAYPKGFKIAFEKAEEASYIQEHVLEGEGTEAWSQMITLTGQKGLATNPQATPIAVLQSIAAGIQRACPDTFAIKPLGALKVSGYDGFAALAGCGTVASGKSRSEIVLLLTVKGAADFYSIQWAERADASSAPPVFDESKWKQRAQQLSPVRLCDRVSGESPPYPSCVDHP